MIRFSYRCIVDSLAARLRALGLAASPQQRSRFESDRQGKDMSPDLPAARPAPNAQSDSEPERSQTCANPHRFRYVTSGQFPRLSSRGSIEASSSRPVVPRASTFPRLH